MFLFYRGWFWVQKVGRQPKAEAAPFSCALLPCQHQTLEKKRIFHHLIDSDWTPISAVDTILQQSTKRELKNLKGNQWPQRCLWRWVKGEHSGDSFSHRTANHAAQHLLTLETTPLTNWEVIDLNSHFSPALLELTFSFCLFFSPFPCI